MDPYAYVGNNPEGRTDPTGHFWPWATMLVGAIAGAVIGVAVTTVTSYATTGKPPSGGELLQAAASGAVSGAIVGLLGPGASVVAAIGIGALSGAAGGVAGRLAYNAVTRTSLSAGLLQAGVEGAIIGGLTGGVFKAAAPLLGRVGRAMVDEEGVLGGLWQRAQQFRQDLNLTSNRALGRNLAFADYNIEGDTGTLVGVSGQRTPPGTVDLPTNRFFRTVATGGNPRTFDAENKLLEYLANAYQNNLNVQGIINLFSEREPCVSCYGVISQFTDMFPNIELNVNWYVPRGVAWH